VKVKNGTKMGEPFCRGSCLVEQVLLFHSKLGSHQLEAGGHLGINSFRDGQ